MKRHAYIAFAIFSFFSHTWAEPVIQGKVGTFQSIDCPEEILPKKGAENITCGYLIAPESHLNPTDKSIKLFVVIANNTASTPQPDPVAFLAGGPGNSASRFVYTGQFDFIQNSRNIIYMDQRGTGLSVPHLPSCAPATINLGIIQQSLNNCKDKLEKIPEDAANFNTVENALDFIMLRKTLSIKKWNLLGASYGTRLGLEIMRLDSQGVRSSTFTSVLPTNRNVFSKDVFANRKRVFELMFSDCKKDPQCNAAYPNLKEEFLALEDYLDGNPHIFRYISGQTGEITEEEGGFVTFLKVMLMDLASVISKATGDLPLRTTMTVKQIQEKINMGRMQSLPSYIHGLYQYYRDGTPLPKQHKSRVFGNNGNIVHIESNKEQSLKSKLNALSLGFYLSVTCREGMPFANIEILDKIAKNYAPYALDQRLMFASLFSTCLLWPSGIASSSFHDPVVSNVPTLIVSGVYDVATPPHWAEAAAKFLPNSTTITLPSGGHSAIFSSSCSLDIFRNFLKDPSKKPDTSCVAKLKPPTFKFPVRHDQANKAQDHLS